MQRATPLLLRLNEHSAAAQLSPTEPPNTRLRDSALAGLALLGSAALVHFVGGSLPLTLVYTGGLAVLGLIVFLFTRRPAAAAVGRSGG